MKENKNGEWLQDIIGEIDDDLLLEAEHLRNRKFLGNCQETKNNARTKLVKQAENMEEYRDEWKKNYGTEDERVTQRKWAWKKLGVIAACVSVFFIGSFLWRNGLFYNNAKDLAGYGKGEGKTECEQEQVKDEETVREDAEQNGSLDIPEAALSAAGTKESTDSMNISEELEEIQITDSDTQSKHPQESEQELTEPKNTERQNLSGSNSGVYVPKKEVSLGNADDMASCMIGFFIYQGRVYIEYEWLEHANALVGEKVGTATGLIDAWTKKDGYVDFAGSVQGDFYEVKGYEPEFMLCMQMEDGAIWFFVNDNDLLLKKGADIFEDYLHLSEKSYEAFYMTNETWNNVKAYEEKKVPVNKADYEKVKKWLAAINEGTIMLTEDVWKDCGIRTFYDEKQLYHLYLEMEDGMLIHLRIFEGGYVMFDGVKEVCVKVDI